MGILASFSPFLHMHMLRGSYPRRRRSIAHETLDLMTAYILLHNRKLEQELQVFYQEIQPEDVRSMLKDSMCKQVSRFTNDDFRSTKLLQQMRLEQLAESSDMEEGFANFVHAIAAVKSLHYVGLEESIGYLKRPYFQNEVSVVGVRCMGALGAVGKKTLALALCNDLSIKGCFQILLFIALSESPFVRGLIEMIWDGIFGRNRYEFQNVEDACMRLQIQLPRLSKSTLLILNDVGSRENMEKSLFQVAGYKTLLTARHRSITPRNHYIQFYQFPLLGQDDVLSLFCYMENLVRHGRVQRPNFPMGNWYQIIISMGYLDSSTPVLDFQWTKKPVEMTVAHLGLCQEAGMAGSLYHLIGTCK